MRTTKFSEVLMQFEDGEAFYIYCAENNLGFKLDGVYWNKDRHGMVMRGHISGRRPEILFGEVWTEVVINGD